jgi:hypothetical protein
MSAIDGIIDACRHEPDRVRVRYRTNGGEWKTSSGREFLVLWEQPFAGTVEIDHAAILPEDAA